MTEKLRTVLDWIGGLSNLSPSTLALMLLVIGPMISYLALPIEGEYWVGLMPEGNERRAYQFCFALDFIGGLLAYIFGRIQQSARKGSKQWKFSFSLLPFVGFGIGASWWTSWRQVRVVMPNALWWEPLITSSIQPMLQLGVNVAQALLEGKFDAPATVQPVQEVQVEKQEAPQPVEKPEPAKAGEVVFDPTWDEATIGDAKGVWAGANGEREGTYQERKAYLIGELNKRHLRMPDVSKSTESRWVTTLAREG